MRRETTRIQAEPQRPRKATHRVGVVDARTTRKQEHHAVEVAMRRAARREHERRLPACLVNTKMNASDENRVVTVESVRKRAKTAF